MVGRRSLAYWYPSALQNIEKPSNIGILLDHPIRGEGFLELAPVPSPVIRLLSRPQALAVPNRGLLVYELIGKTIQQGQYVINE